VPELRPADRDAEGGRGLQLVVGIAAQWGLRLAATRRADGELVRAIAQLASPPDGSTSMSKSPQESRLIRAIDRLLSRRVTGLQSFGG
jgi:hypothetical protein